MSQQQQQENNSNKEEVSLPSSPKTTSKLASSKVFSCEIQPESFQFNNQTTKDVLIIFNPYPFAVSYEILSQNPEFYRFHNKGSIEPRKNVNVPILLKAQSVLDRAKQEQQLNKEEGDQSGGLKDQMMVKLKATVKTPSKQEQSVSFKKILPVTITYLSDAPEPNQNSFMSSSAVFTTAPSASSASTTTTKPTTPLVGILKKRENVVDESVTATATVAQSKEQESVEQEEEEEEEEEQHRWQGVMNYVSILVGAALVLLVSLSQDAVVAPTKSLFASFFIGMFAMYIQMTIQRERESRSNTTTPVVTIDSRRKSR